MGQCPLSVSITACPGDNHRKSTDLMGESREKTVIPTFQQVGAARELLSWTQERLADASGVARSTIEAFEQGKSKPQRATMLKIVDAFELRGIVFTNGDNPTVSLQRDKAKLPP